jgi:uncharacterized protein (DUF4415 family)
MQPYRDPGFWGDLLWRKTYSDCSQACATSDGIRRSGNGICEITESTSRTHAEFSTAQPSSADRIAMAKSGTKSSVTSKAGKSRWRARSAGRSAGSSRSGARTGSSEKKFTVVSRDAPIKGKTDWARIDALTDEDIAAAVASDPDAVPIDVDWSDAVLVIPPKKKAISIRVDEDVLDFFKREGEGYQRRINAVLRSYMQQKAKPKKRA